MENIYKTPDAEVAPTGESSGAARFPLYKISAVGVATFFGTVLAGGYIASRNLQRLGREKQAQKVLLWSGIALIGVLAVSFLLPGSSSGLAFTVAQAVVMVQLAKSWFQDDLDRHIENGGAVASNWRAFGIALLFCLGMIVAIIPITVLVIFGMETLT